MWGVFFGIFLLIMPCIALENSTFYDDSITDSDTNNEEIQQYFNTNECDTNKTNICKTIKDFLFSLETLEKIQQNNLILAYKNESTRSAKRKSDIKYKENALKILNDGGEQKLDYHEIQSKEIVMVTKEEYKNLRTSMLRFCKNFDNLKAEERHLLFTLKWHGIAIFEDENFIQNFCSHKF